MRHEHEHVMEMKDWRMQVAMFLTFGFVAVEALAGWRAGSLALLSDAGHNLGDGLALVLAALAVWVSRKPASDRWTFGHHRFTILTALINATTLILMALAIIWEAARRLRHPEPVASGYMIAVAAVALVINTVITLMFRRSAEGDLNLRSVYLHMLWDSLASAGVIIAGLVVRFTGYELADPIVSFIIALLILQSSWSIFTEALDILLEGTPARVDLAKLEATLRSVPGVCDVHDLHVWSITSGILAATCHVTVAEETSVRHGQALADAVADVLAREYGIAHTTVQVEVDGCSRGDRLCTMSPTAASAEPAPAQP